MKLRSTILVVGIFLLTGTYAQIDAKFRGLPPEIISWVMKDVCSGGCTGPERVAYRRNIRYERHDLNGDHNPEIFVYIDHPDVCGNHFNCDYSVFQRRAKSYRLIASGYSALHVTNTHTKGYRDLESRHDNGVCTLRGGAVGRDIYLTVLHYDGTKYRSTELGGRCLKSLPIPAFRIGRI